MRILIVDDEASSRENLRAMFASYCPDVEVIAEAASGKQALAELKKLRPEAVFADIDMPGMDGLELAAIVTGMKIPVVMATAYEQYAIEAIRANALDYILKPIKIRELQEAVARLRGATEALTPTTQETGSQDAQQTVPRMLSLPWDTGFKLVDIKSIVRLKSQNSYTEVFFKENKVLISKSLGLLEKELHGLPFFRIHNSHIINLEFLDSYSTRDGGKALMVTGEAVPVSRRRCPAFREAVASYIH